MQAEFFKKQIERLRGVYAEGSLTPERIDIWWKKFRHEPDHVFENAMNHIIVESTSRQLPAMSRVSEAMGFFRSSPSGASMQVLLPAYGCEVCRDFGYRFEGDLVVACKICKTGRSISPAVLAKAQKSYDAGAIFLAKARNRKAFLPELPYDPSERFVDVGF